MTALFSTITNLSVTDPLHGFTAVSAFATSIAERNSPAFVIRIELFHPTPENNRPIIKIRVDQ
jgi:hypothetical protein